MFTKLLYEFFSALRLWGTLTFRSLEQDLNQSQDEELTKQESDKT